MPARAAVLLLCCLALPLFADTFYVMGDFWTPRSLAWAINQANDKAGRDQILFGDLWDPNQPSYISFDPGYEQPPITEALDIDGTGTGSLYLDQWSEAPPFLTFRAGSSTSTLRNFTFPTLTVEPGVTELVLQSNFIWSLSLSGSGHNLHDNHLNRVNVVNAVDTTFSGNQINTFVIVDSPGTILDGNDFGPVGGFNYIGGTRIATDGVVVRNNRFYFPVAVLSTGVSLTGNRISNHALPIDLGGDGPTPNDPAPDADTGPNGLQNYPILSSATPAAGAVVVTGTLTSAPLTPYQIELFISRAGVFGPRTLADSFAAVTDAAGELTFTRSITPPMFQGQVLVTTATNRALTATPGNEPNSTSEASPPLALFVPGRLGFATATSVAPMGTGTGYSNRSFSVVRTSGLDGTITVDYATADGSATAPADYLASSGTLVFGPA